MRWLVAFVALALITGCAVVPKIHRRYLADPTMQPDESTGARSRSELHTAREGAAGGDGEPAGGGCGCSN
jgi:hypothetical protein